MTAYRKKPVVIEAVTFDELVAHGLTQSPAVANGMPWHFTYAGHVVTHENDDCYLIPTLEGTMKMGRDDMLITGVKGEIYPCKRDIFDATYDLVSDPVLAATMYEKDGEHILHTDFGSALVSLKFGRRVTRAGWNAKGMFVYLVPAASYPAQTGAAKAHFGENAMVPYDAYMALKNAQGTVSTWVPSVSDCLATDWHEVTP